MNRASPTILMVRLHFTLAKALLTQNVSVTSVGIPAKAGLANRENEAHSLTGLRYVPYMWRGNSLVCGFRAIPVIARLLRQVNPAVIHVNAVSDLLPVMIAVHIACLRRRRPSIVAMSRNGLTWTSRYEAWLRAKLVKYLADGFVALTGSHREQMLELGLPSEMLTFIPNPYDRAVADLAVKNQQKSDSLHSGATRITCVGALRKCKAQDILIEAAASVLQAHPNVHFDLIGSAWPREEAYEKGLRTRIEQLRLTDHIHLLGGLPHKEVMTSLTSTDVVAFPTRAEMMPRAVIEAMVLGKPVVASAVDGILDLIQDRRTGILVSPGDAVGLAKAISELIENPAFAAELATAGQAHVREFCSPERVGRLFCEFYAQLMESRCSGGTRRQ